MGSVRRSVVISSVSSLLSRLIGFLSVITVARLLTPEEIGVYVIAASLMMLTSQLSTLGTNNYLIREKNLTLEKQQSCLALSIMISWGIGFIVVIASPFISEFYDLQALSVLILILSLSYFVNPFTSLTTAMLSKYFQYGKYMTIEIIGSAVSLITTVTFIMLDYGFYSMAIGEAGSAISKLILAFFLRPQGTSWKPRIFDLKPIISVGIFTSLINILGRMEFNVADLILGRISNTTTVAVTSRAIGLHVFLKDILGNGIAQVATPYLAVNANDRQTLKQSFLVSNNLAAAFVAPPLAVAAIVAQPLIYLFFGEQWEASIPIAQVLGAWIVIRTLISFSTQALIIAHEERKLLIARCLSLGSLCFLVALCTNVLTINVGFAFVGYACIDLVICLSLLRLVFGLSFFEFFQSIYKSLLLILICAASAFLLYIMLPAIQSPLVLLIIVGVTMIPIWIGGLYILEHPLWSQLSGVPVLGRLVR